MDRFEIQETDFEGVYIIKPIVHKDYRGYFVKTYDEEEFKAKGINLKFVQDDQSCSAKGAIRGLHFQKEHPQGKLVRVVNGKVFDVCVDLRKDSLTYGKWMGIVLSAKNKKQLYVPRGFAHGILSLEDNSIFVYKTDEVYYPGDEGGLCWDDEDLAIDWPLDDIEEVLVTDKDKNWPSFKNLDFHY